MSLDTQAAAVFQAEMTPEAPEEVVEEQSDGFVFDFSFLKAKTGAGSVESYLDHPFNFTKSRGIAQMLRGFTGLLGALDLAVVDIGIGAVNVVREGRAPDVDGTGQ